jgi:hypothetical protein
LTLLRIEGGFLKEWLAWKLARRSVGRTMLDSGMSVTKVTEVVDILDSQEGTGGQRMNWCVTPLISS